MENYSRGKYSKIKTKKLVKTSCDNEKIQLVVRSRFMPTQLFGVVRQFPHCSQQEVNRLSSSHTVDSDM